MAQITVRPRKLSELDAAIPGLAAVRRAVKTRTQVQVRVPKTLTITDESRSMHLNDGESGRRFGLDLQTMELSEAALFVSSGEWTCHGGPQNTQPIGEAPNAYALVDCVWHDYYGTFLLTIQVRPGALARELGALPSSSVARSLQ